MMKKALWLAAASAFALLALLLAVLTVQVWRHARIHEARHADVIVVLGAAEYNGRPSPVFRARLEHALQLYARGMAPRIVTTGGSGGDPVFTEAEVGRAWLIQRGVPSEAIIVETGAESTAGSVAATGEILRRMNLRSCIVVTDGYHLFRSKRMFQELGFEAYGSPRPGQPETGWWLWWLCMRQAAAYMAWSVGVAV